MWFKTKQFNEESNDFKKMVSLICSLNSEELYDWSLGRIIDWKYGLWNDKKQNASYFSDTTTLWYSYLDELAGFIVSEDGSNELQYVVDKKYKFLYDKMIKLSKEKYATIETVCSIDDSIKIDYLTKNGFRDAGEYEVTFVYNADNFISLNTNLPHGFTIQTMESYNNYVSQINVKRNAFRNNRELTPKDYYAYEFVKQSPLYDPSMDFVVVNELQEAVACCEGFIDYQNSIMEIERVCTHSDYRQKGLAKAVISECIKQGLQRGVKKIQITGLNEITQKLYASYGNSEKIIKRKFVYS